MRRAYRRIDDAKLTKLWYTRLSDKQIAVRMDHDVGTLRRRAANIGLPARRSIWNAKLPEEIQNAN